MSLFDKTKSNKISNNLVLTFRYIVLIMAFLFVGMLTNGHNLKAANVAKNSAGTEYGTLQAAIDATSDDTITLLSDVSECVTVAAGKTIFLDLNNLTLRCESSEEIRSVGIENSGTLTVSKGTIIVNNTYANEVSNGTGAAWGIYQHGSSSKVTIDEVNITVSSLTNVASTSGIQHESGDVIINNSVINAVSENSES